MTERLNPIFKNCGKIALLIAALHYPLFIAHSETLCVMRSRSIRTVVQLVPAGSPCPSRTIRSVALLDRESVDRLVRDAVSDHLSKEPPMRFHLSTEGIDRPVCLGINIKNHCGDADHCTLHLRRTTLDGSVTPSEWWLSFDVEYNSETRRITLPFDGFIRSGTLGNGTDSLLAGLGGNIVGVTTTMPTDGCRNLTNMIDQTPDTLWFRAEYPYALDGALID